VTVERPVFFYDIVSPYAYLASQRVGELIPDAEWQPVLAAGLQKLAGRTSWALGPQAQVVENTQEIARRSEARGLPPLTWPTHFEARLPVGRAAVLAKRRGREVEFSQAAFRAHWVEGRDLADLDQLAALAPAAEMEPAELREGIGAPDVKDEFRAVTERAAELGAIGVPTVVVDGEPFWGDDRLEDAAARAAAGRP
jgi:2-hydroxychromene-2-carboxylate isomerase